MIGLHFDDISAGQTWTSPGRTMTEADIQQFCALTGDYNPLHSDAEFASQGPFGQRIAHGLLGLSMAVGLFSRNNVIDGTVIGFLGIDWKFTGPIFIGDTIHAVVNCAEKRVTSKPGRGIVHFQAALVNQKDQTVQEGRWTMMMKARVPAATPANGATHSL